MLLGLVLGNLLYSPESAWLTEGLGLPAHQFSFHPGQASPLALRGQARTVMGSVLVSAETPGFKPAPECLCSPSWPWEGTELHAVLGTPMPTGLLLLSSAQALPG